MKIYFFHLILKVLFLKDNTHDALHLTTFNQFRKNIKNVYLRTLKNFQ